MAGIGRIPPEPRFRLGPVSTEGTTVRASAALTTAFVDGTDLDMTGFNKVAIANTFTTHASVAGGFEMKVEWSDDDTTYWYEPELKVSGVYELYQQRIYALKGAAANTAYYGIFLLDVLARYMRCSFKSDQKGNYATLAAEAWGVRG